MGRRPDRLPARTATAITIDADAKKLIGGRWTRRNWAERKAAWKKPEPRVKRGVLAKYARTVRSASEGAVTYVRPSGRTPSPRVPVLGGGIVSLAAIVPLLPSRVAQRVGALKSRTFATLRRASPLRATRRATRALPPDRFLGCRVPPWMLVARCMDCTVGLCNATTCNPCNDPLAAWCLSENGSDPFEFRGQTPCPRFTPQGLHNTARGRARTPGWRATLPLVS